MVRWVGLIIPFAYIGILVGSLATFSSLYRKRKASKSATLEPWFPPHLQRNIYLSLLYLEPEPGKDKPPTVPESILKAALLQRATEDIRRILQIRGQKPALSTLLQRGSVGDDLWQRFLRAEKEIEAELRDVVEEANALSPTWGQTIFQSANEIVNNEALRARIAELQAQGQADREWWDKKKASIQSEFMKELDKSSGTTGAATTAVAAGNAGQPKPNSAAGTGRGSTDEDDAVMVEGGGPAAGGGKASQRRKKGKK